jgi:hypothetical protein
MNWVSFGIHGDPYLFMILVVEFENDVTLSAAPSVGTFIWQVRIRVLLFWAKLLVRQARLKATEDMRRPMSKQA